VTCASPPPTTAHRPRPRCAAPAADLDFWLWNREPLGPVEQSCDGRVLAELRKTIGGGID
jgi:hypothetical protein